jgi:RNA polymerase sigma factor (sigma-70 family)
MGLVTKKNKSRLVNDPRMEKGPFSAFELRLKQKHILHELRRYIYDPCFDNRFMRKTIIAPMPDLDKFEEKRKANVSLKTSDLPPEIAYLYNEALLTREQEIHLFRKMNYFKYQAKKLIDRNHGLNAREQNRVEKYLFEAIACKKQLAASNLRLGVHNAKIKAYKINNPSKIYELISEAYLAILRAINCYDWTSSKFSTYATWAITNNLSRSNSDERERDSHFTNNVEDEMLDTIDNQNENKLQNDDRKMFLESAVSKLLDKLSKEEGGERCKEVIIRRFLSTDSDETTLESVGNEFGVSKERIRQIQVRSFKQMKRFVENNYVSLNGFLEEFI